jgi:hypothetical protein
MAKARRKMRRQLMKKLKKGYLTPGEREDLMQLDREVNRANRQAAGMTGAGLGSALLIASKMGAGDALGDWLDTRQNKKEFEAETEAMGERTADQIAQENASRLVQQAREEMKDGSVETPDTLDIEEIDEKEEDFKEEGSDWRKKQREYDKMERQRGVESGRMIGFDRMYPAGQPVREQVGPRAEESDEYRIPMPVDLPEYPLDMLIRMQESVPFSTPAGPPVKGQSGPRAEESDEYRVPMFVDLPEYPLDMLIRMQESVPLPTSLPEVEVQAQGGYTPFLRAMRDRMRKKYGSR